jgi:putative phosphoesterase
VRTAFISDVHGNLPALERTIEQIERQACERIICLGDVFGYLTDGQACFDRLKERGAEFLLGNHEAMLLNVVQVDADTATICQLDRQRATVTARTLETFATLTPFKEMSLGGKRFLLVHGTPADPLRGYAYPDGDHAWMSALPHDVVVMGNTHRPFQLRQGHILTVNVGSVGLPRDVGHLASFGVFDDATGEFELVRTAIDIHEIRERYADAHASVLAVFGRSE